MRIHQRRILVTGASGGIGQELCLQLQQFGAVLVLVARTPEQLEHLAARLSSGHHYVAADIGSSEGRDAIFAACQKIGGVDGVINLAGIMEFTLFEEQASASIEAIINTNLLAVMLLSQQLLPMLRQRPEAAIVNVGSIFGSIGHPGFAAYCASKAGMKCFTEAMARELADSNIAVSYIAPRATETSLNGDAVRQLNAALGNRSDSPVYVASQIVDVLLHNPLNRFIGWPEKFFVKLNGLFPSLVHSALVKQLHTIKQFARNTSSQKSCETSRGASL